ncbi:hypothetical protein Lser_V15G31261 [Lactuca serriola]
MSSSDNYGLPHPSGKSFPLEDDLPRVNQGDISFPSSCIGGSRNHTSLPPPLPVILPDPGLHQLEKFKVTRAILACKHQDGKSICEHILRMKSHIDRLGMLGVGFPKKLVVDLVLQSLSEVYSQFVKDYYMTENDVTLIDLTYLLVVAKVVMLWHTGQANLFGGSISKVSWKLVMATVIVHKWFLLLRVRNRPKSKSLNIRERLALR